MEQENIEEIILKGRNEVICKKCNNSGSLSVGGDFVPLSDNEELPEIPKGARTKINGVDIGLFFERLGKNSINRQELGFDKQEKTEAKNKGNFDLTPWIISGGIAVFISSLLFFLF